MIFHSKQKHENIWKLVTTPQCFWISSFFFRQYIGMNQEINYEVKYIYSWYPPPMVISQKGVFSTTLYIKPNGISETPSSIKWKRFTKSWGLDPGESWRMDGPSMGKMTDRWIDFWSHSNSNQKVNKNKAEFYLKAKKKKLNTESS